MMQATFLDGITGPKSSRGRRCRPGAKIGRPKTARWASSGAAMARLLDGEPLTMVLLAAVAGITDRHARRLVEEARKATGPSLSVRDRINLRKAYGKLDDPAVRVWLDEQGIHPCSRRGRDLGKGVSPRPAA